MTRYHYPQQPPRTVVLAKPPQTSSCAGCGQRITELERRPCDRCGSINRNVSVSVGDTLGVADKLA